MLCYFFSKTGGCLIKLLLFNWILCFRKTFSEVAVPFSLPGICTKGFWRPEISHFVYFFANWEHFGCLALDGCREGSLAGSRAFFLPDSVSDCVLPLSFPSLKLLLSGGWRKSLPWRNLQKIKPGDPFDPGFIQHRSACQGHAHTFF